MLVWDDCVCNSFLFLVRILYTPHFTVIDLLVPFSLSPSFSLSILPLLSSHH
jgi:hypothetical protein